MSQIESIPQGNWIKNIWQNHHLVMHLSSIQGFPGKQNFEKNDALPRLRNTGNTFSNSNT